MARAVRGEIDLSRRGTAQGACDRSAAPDDAAPVAKITEFRILHFLASRPGRVLSRDEIIDAALGRNAAVFDRTIDVHVTAIRKKLGKGGEQIETIRGFGYKFRDQSNAPAPVG